MMVCNKCAHSIEVSAGCIGSNGDLLSESNCARKSTKCIKPKIAERVSGPPFIRLMWLRLLKMVELKLRRAVTVHHLV